MKLCDIVEVFVVKLIDDDCIVVVEVVGFGFLNMCLVFVVWQGVVKMVLIDQVFGQLQMGQGVKVNVEFVFVNLIGLMYVGYICGVVFGDVLVSLLDYVGYDVICEYYINDGGVQVDVFVWLVYLCYFEVYGQVVEFLEGIYLGDYFVFVG